MLCLAPLYAIPLLLVTFGAYNELLAAIVVKPMAKSHIIEAYPDEGLYVADTGYEFKGNCLFADIESTASVDTHFKIWYDLGWPEYVSDTYDNIADGINTFKRLEAEFDQLVRDASLNIEQLDYVSGTLCEYDPDIQKDGLHKDSLALDIEFDMYIHGGGYGNIHCRFLAPAADVNDEYAAELIVTYDKVLADAGIRYRYMDFHLTACGEDGESDYSDEYILIFDIPAEDIAARHGLAE